MPSLTKSAIDYLSCGFSILPVNDQKRPAIKEWTTLQTTPLKPADCDDLFKNAWGIAIIGGKVSDGLEFIDFDAHEKDIQSIYEFFISDERCKFIFNRHEMYVERSRRGGYHIAYRYECSGRRDGNRKLAEWENKNSMIETRGEGGYCIVYPTEGYVPVMGDLESLPTLSEDERNYLIELACSFTRTAETQQDYDTKSKAILDNTDPVSWFNWNKDNYAKKLLEEIGWTKVRYDEKEQTEYWLRPGKQPDENGWSATWGKRHNALYVFTQSSEHFTAKAYYTPFQILVRLKFSDDYNAAIAWIAAKYNLHAAPARPILDAHIQSSYSTDPHTDPVSYYNNTPTCIFHAKHRLEDIGWTPVQDTTPQVWRAKDASEDEVTATFDTVLHVVTDSEPFKGGVSYTPFQVLVLVMFSGNHRAATEWVIHKYFSEGVPYMRVGTDYFKLIDKTDRFGIPRKELKRWTKDEIKQDHTKKYLDDIPHFDDFTIEPNNLHYRPVVNNCYNLYREFPHAPSPGEWKWTEVLLRHIFADQYDLGIRYLQALYLNPDHIMPILVLVSKERQTGKTTFVNWLGMIFGDNMANISPEDLVNGFNSTYAASNIIAVEETLIEKNLTVEKIKALATTKFITVNQKFVSQYRMPFFGKIILTSNNENKFARIDQEEIRFFIRKVPVPTVHNHNIEQDMINEIPAFLHYLTTLQPVDWSRDRTGFTPDELNNSSLVSVKLESRSETCKDIIAIVEDFFNNEIPQYDDFLSDAKSFKDRFFPRDQRNGYDWIRKVLKDELNLEQEPESIYYHPFRSPDGKTGRPFKFLREKFTDQPSQSPPKQYQDAPF